MSTQPASDLNTLKRERDRFVKLAFCRADVLIELDRAGGVVFAAGATEPLMGIAEPDMPGKAFLSLIVNGHRDKARSLLAGGGREGRIDDAALHVAGPGGASIPVAVSGYRAPEFDNHYFLALKVALPAPGAAAADAGSLMDQAAFAETAVARIRDLERDGDAGQVTLVRLKRIKDLLKDLGASDRQGLMSAIARILKSYSVDGNTAGQIDDESFGYAHRGDVDPERVNMEIEEAAQTFLPADAELEARSVTLDADGAGMTEDQVAKALVHTMNQFCSTKSRVTARRLSDSLDELMSDTVETVKYIKRASDRKEFDLVFMPVCDLRLGKVHHFEALSRFRDAERARSTFQIIGLAENLGLIVDFDYAVLDKTIGLIGDFRRQGPLPAVAINVSSISLSNPAFVDRVHRRLAKDSSLSQRLMFELTESAEVDDLQVINAAIQGFREKGFRFCLDDFGAGSASFDYLNALEVDVVKFDGPVIRRACSSKRGNDLLGTMAKMCTTGGLQTVAEMVEDKNIANQVFYCGIDYGQGWYFGKPNADPFVFAEDFAGRA